MPKLTRLITEGTPSEVGTMHGAAFASEIREYVDDRVELSAIGTDLDRDGILGIASRMLDAHERYDAALFVEMLAGSLISSTPCGLLLGEPPSRTPARL